MLPFRAGFSAVPVSIRPVSESMPLWSWEDAADAPIPVV